MKIRLIFLLTCLLLGISNSPLASELVLVVNKDSAVQTINRTQIINIYMGRYNQFPVNHKVTPLDNNADKKDFYRKLINKSIPQVNAYWSRLKYSGRAEYKPDSLEGHKEVIELLGIDKSAIAYVPRDLVSNQFRIIYELD